MYARPALSPTKITIPLFTSPVSAGFPAPADDEVAATIDLNELLVKNKPATYLVRVQGNSLKGAGIFEDDLLVVDASRPPHSGQIVVAAVEGEFLVKRYVVEKSGTYLKAENELYPPLLLNDKTDASIFGVVTGVVRKLL